MSEAIINQVIDERYLIQERITAGGMAIVYKATDQNTGDTIALKLLQTSWAEHQDVIERFEREANIMAGLKHPHIVGFVGTGQYEKRPYIAMDYLPGGSLSDLLKQVARSKLLATSRLLKQMASALDYAHGKNVIHRDLKPGNILLKNDKHAALTDFGIARVLEHTQITVFGQMPGTPQYMSPEQASGLVDDIDHLSDLYSLTIIAYLLATGRLPFSGGDPMGIMNAHLTQLPPTPSEVNPNLPTSLDAVLLKGLEKEKADRYQTAGAFVNDFEKAILGYEDLDVTVKVKKKLPPLPEEIAPTHIFSEDAEVLTHQATYSPIARRTQPDGRSLLTVMIPIMFLAVVIIGGLIVLSNSDNDTPVLPSAAQTNQAIADMTQTQIAVVQLRTQDAQGTRGAEQEIAAITQTWLAAQQAEVDQTRTHEAEIGGTATQEQATLQATATQAAMNQQGTSTAQAETAIAQANRDATATQGGIFQQETSTAQAQTAIAQEMTATGQYNVDATRTREADIGGTATAEDATRTREAVLIQRTTFAEQAIATVSARQTATVLALTAVIERQTEVALAITQTAQVITPTVTPTSTELTPTPIPNTYESDLAGVIEALLDTGAADFVITTTRINCERFVPIYTFLEVQIEDGNPEFTVLTNLIAGNDDEAELRRIYDEYCFDETAGLPLDTTITLRPEDTARIVDLRLLLQQIETDNS